MKHCVPLFSGIGNIIQSLPFVETIRARYGGVIACRHVAIDYADAVLEVVGPHFDEIIDTYEQAVSDPGVHVYKTPDKSFYPETSEHRAWFITNEIEEPKSLEIDHIGYSEMTPRHRVVLWPEGKENWPCKKWPYWEELADMLGADVAVVGLEQVFKFGPHVTDYRGQLSLAETGGIIRNADMFIGNEGGISHYAAALGIKTFIVYGATEPRKNMPPANAERISLNLECQSCQFGKTRCGRTKDPQWKWRFEGCDTRKCLRQLSPVEVAMQAGIEADTASQGLRIAPVMICSGVRYSNCAQISLKSFVKHHNHPLYVVADEPALKALKQFHNEPLIRFLPLEKYAEEAKKIVGVNNFVKTDVLSAFQWANNDNPSRMHDRSYSSLKPILMELAIKDYAPSTTHILSIDTDTLFTGNIMDRSYNYLDDSTFYLVSREDSRTLRSGRANNPGSGYTMWMRNSEFLKLFIEGFTAKMGQWKGGGSQDLINMLRDRVKKYTLIPDPLLHFISPDLRDPDVPPETIRTFQPAYIHLHGPKSYERLLRYEQIFERANEISPNPVEKAELFPHTRDWYIHSGYHGWISEMSYDDVVASLPKHRERLETVLDAIDFAILVEDRKVLEVAFNNGKTAWWALERYGQIFDVSMFDFDPQVVEWAKKIKPAKWDVDIFEADVVSIPKPEGSFHFIFCLDVIEHLPEDTYHKMIAELYRLLTVGGWILVYIGKGHSRGHIHSISDKSAIHDFQAAGFKFDRKIDWRGNDRDSFWMVRK